MTITNEFYYCYSPRLHVFLQDSGQRYTCAGLNEKTLRKFWQYKRTDGLHALLADWAENKPSPE
ncbi:hypothetical protein [Sporosarcina phage Lietuvens]|nr:hypothetical protein [Sporosarcina phage Lietuvens]